MGTHFTIGQIRARYQAPYWLVRKAVDALGEPLPRAGLYRMVPVALMPRIDAVLRAKGYAPRVEEASSCVA